MKYYISGTFCVDQYASTRREALRMGAAMARSIWWGGIVMVVRQPAGVGAYAEIVGSWKVPARGKGRPRRDI